MPLCAKTFSSWGRKFEVLLRHCLWVLSEMFQHLQLWWLVFLWCPFCGQAMGPKFILQLYTNFQNITGLQIDTRIQWSRLSWVFMNIQLVGKCQTFTYMKSWGYELFGHICPPYWANSSPIICVVLTQDSWTTALDSKHQHPHVFLSMLHCMGSLNKRKWKLLSATLWQGELT